MIAERSYLNQPAEKQNLFLATKLELPDSMHPLVSRSRLLERVDQGLEGRLTLICAPAGAGKTMFFTDWVRHNYKMPVAWVSLDEYDNDPANFWLYICTALGHSKHSILRKIKK